MKISLLFILLFSSLLSVFGNSVVSADQRRLSPHESSRHRVAPPPRDKRPIYHPVKKHPEKKHIVVKKPPKYKPYYDHYYKPGHRIKYLPRGYSRVIYDRGPYYFYDGFFYQPFIDGYMVIDAPIGAIVLSLPRLHHVIRHRNDDYYVAGNTYYRRHPRGYIVIDPPSFILNWR